MKPVHRTDYCRYCYAPLVSTSGASQRCARCGRVHVRVDHQAYWSLEPRLLRIEKLIKAGVVLFILAIYLTVALQVDMGSHPVNLFFSGPLLMLGGVLWWTAGLVTRKPRYFSPQLLWGTVLLMLVIGPPVLLFVMDVIARRQSFGREYWQASLLLASPAVPMLLVGVALKYLGARFETFKRERIASGSR